MMLQKVSPRATPVSSWLPALVDWHACFDVSPNAELLPVSWIMQGEKISSVAHICRFICAYRK